MNAIDVTHIPFIASSDVLPWNQEDDDPLFDTTDDLTTVQVLRINTSKFISDDVVNYTKPPQTVPILDKAPPNIDDTITIEVKGVAVEDVDVVCGQFNSGTDATITNLLVYLHDYKAYDREFKCPVKLPGDIGSNNEYPLEEGKLHIPALHRTDI